jgi:hypothetical protein
VRDASLELVETVRPAVPVELTARLGVERALSEDDLGGLAEIPERSTRVSTSSGSGSSHENV